MKLINLVWIVILFLAVETVAQDKRSLRYGKTITAADLRAKLSVLAHDSLEGRETGERGQIIAAQYIADKFKSYGLQPPVPMGDEMSYFQMLPLKQSTWANLYVRKDEEKVENLDGFVYFSQAETMGEEYIEAIFIGDGSNVKDLNVDGKFVASVNDVLTEQTMEEAKELGAKGVISIMEDESQFNSLRGRAGRFFRPRLRFDFDNNSDMLLIMNSEKARWLFGKSASELAIGDKASFILNADKVIVPKESMNVLGFLEGSEKPEEVLVITAHYDHIGIIGDQINNGADDDGSGTSSVLEIAEAFTTAAKKGKRPKRSILFMTVAGEEKGLLGSRYYTDVNPIFPLENTVANLNIDMVGRVDDAHTDNPDYIYVIGSDKLSSELHNLSEKVNNAFVGINLDYKYNDENDPNRFYYRSDHYNFAKNDIPVIFYFNGTHADYHRPTDTIEKINFEQMEKRARLVFYTGWEIANREKRIVLDEERIKVEGG
ncbi:MAG: M28 family peptidase [Cytophagales bacterium]|nr:M28 family peptidase [Cytophagales bacterium]